VFVINVINQGILLVNVQMVIVAVAAAEEEVDSAVDEVRTVVEVRIEDVVHMAEAEEVMAAVVAVVVVVVVRLIDQAAVVTVATNLVIWLVIVHRIVLKVFAIIAINLVM